MERFKIKLFRRGEKKKLGEWLYRYYGKRVIVLLDEYDTPMKEAYINGFWDELTSCIRALLTNTFKTKPYLERGMMTGTFKTRPPVQKGYGNEETGNTVLLLFVYVQYFKCR